MIDRKQFLDSVSMTQVELARRTGLSEKTIRRWMQRKIEVELETNKRVARELGVSIDYFDRPERVRDLLRSAWQALGERAKLFSDALQATAKVDAEAVFEHLCIDLMEHWGKRIVLPTVNKLESTVHSADALAATETFLGCCALMLINCDHQLSVRVDAAKPMSLPGVSHDVTPRLLIDYHHAPGTSSRLPELEGANLRERSPHSVAFEVPDAAEGTAEEGCERFVAELIRCLPLDQAKELLGDLGTGDDDKAKSSDLVKAIGALDADNRTEVLETLDDEIDARNLSDNHFLGLALAETPPHWAEHLKGEDYLPSLRIACLSNASVRASASGVLQCTERQLKILLRTWAIAIETRRAALVASGAINVNITTGDGASVQVGENCTQNNNR